MKDEQNTQAISSSHCNIHLNAFLCSISVLFQIHVQCVISTTYLPSFEFTVILRNFLSMNNMDFFSSASPSRFVFPMMFGPSSSLCFPFFIFFCFNSGFGVYVPFVFIFIVFCLNLFQLFDLNHVTADVRFFFVSSFSFFYFLLFQFISI